MHRAEPRRGQALQAKCCIDVLRVVKNPRSSGAEKNVLDAVFGDWVRAVLAAATRRGKFVGEGRVVLDRYALLHEMVRTLDRPSLERRGREVLEHVEAVACACLLLYDASVGGADDDDDDQGAVAAEAARRWVGMIAPPAAGPARRHDGDGEIRDEVDMDRKIFLGTGASPSGSSSTSSSSSSTVARHAKL